MKYFIVIIACFVSFSMNSQVDRVLVNGNEIHTSLNLLELESIIETLQAQVAALQAAQSSAFDGDYSSLNNPPTIPSNVSDLEFVCGSSYTYEGHDYATVLIGGQCWFAENLRSENYTDGSVIPADLDNAAWSATTAGAVTVQDEGSSNEGTNLATYGRLYNWYAVDDARGLCPSGWHVPTDSEYMTLEMELGMSYTDANNTGFRGTDQCAQMKSSASDSPAFDGTNTSGFSGLAGGSRNDYGDFSYGGYNGFFWSASANGTNAWYRFLDGGLTVVIRYNSSQRYGFSVRCVRD